ncbi:hypothetical protein X975_00194, partial [Stegodyphus mimosarum]
KSFLSISYLIGGPHKKLEFVICAKTIFLNLKLPKREDFRHLHHFWITSFTSLFFFTSQGHLWILYVILLTEIALRLL